MQQRAYLAVLMAALLAGVSGVFVKSISLPPAAFAAIRCGVPVLLMGVLLLMLGRNPFHGNLRLMAFASLLNALRMYLFIYAYRHAPISQAIVVFYTWPLFTTVYSAIFLREIITRRQVVLLLLAFAGLVVVNLREGFSLSDPNVLGLGAALFHAATYALTVVIFKREGQHYSPPETILFQNLAGAFIFLPFLLLATPTLADWGLSITHGALMGTGGFFLFFYGLQRLPASRASMLTYVEVLSAAAFGILLFGDRPGWQLLVGGALILGSTALIRR
ncbi:MAG: EamA family transporter [Bacteroidia bacterium]